MTSSRLRLLRQLTTAAPSWGLWKGADDSEGDVDSIAVPDDWSAIEMGFLTWAEEEHFQWVLVCAHPPGALVLAAFGGADAHRLHQLDVIAHKQFHGALLFRAHDLGALLELDCSRRYRRLRPGAEGLLRLAFDPSDDGARLLVQQDLAGAELVAERAGTLGRALLRTLRGGGRGRVVAAAIARAVVSPRLLGDALLFDLRWRWRCPVLRALRANRTAPADLVAWLTEVRKTHVVHDLR